MIERHPAIRPLEVSRVDDGENRGVVLSDRLGLSEPTFVPEALLPIVGRCTGERTLDQIRREAAAQYGQELTIERVAEIVDQLDERRLLLGERFQAAAREAADAFLSSRVRAPSHAGSAGYPAEADALRTALDRMLDLPESIGTRGERPPRGLVAPHIDLARGGSGYRAAYRALAQTEPSDLYVIFGTGHAGPEAPITGLPLDWRTPLGTTRTRRSVVEAIHAACGAPSPTDLLIHRDEHSIEFQVLLLQHLHERLWPGHPFAVAAFLCGQFPSADGDPLREPWLADLLGAFHDAEAAGNGRVTYLAGADLAHIGPFFGDAEPVTTERLEALAASERERLARLEQGDPGAFHSAVVSGGNPDRVCSAPAITLTAALAGGKGRLLRYDQARADDGSQTVTFCAMSFDGERTG